MTTQVNRLKCGISNAPGAAGDLTIGSAASGYRTFDATHDGLSFDCLFLDGTAWEVRTGCVYTHSGASLSRGTLEDSSTGSAISLSSSSAVVVTATAGWASDVDDVASNGGFVFVRHDGTSLNQTLTNSAWSRLRGNADSPSNGPFLSEIKDERGWWNASIARFQPTLPGKYQFGFATAANFSGSTGVGAALLAAAVYKNGTALFRGTRAEFYLSTANASFTLGSYAGGVVEMNGTTDYLEPWVYAGAAGTPTVVTIALDNIHSLTSRYLGK